MKSALFHFAVVERHRWRLTVRDLGPGGDHGSAPFHQVREPVHRNLSGFHQRPPGEHGNQSYQGYRRRSLQVQRPD